MALRGTDPWDIGELQSEINRLFRSFGDWDSGSSSATAGWVPSADIYEHDDRFEMFIDLPGVDPNSVDITLERGVLTVSGERAAPAVSADERTVSRRIERGQGRFYRRFVLPDSIDSDKVNARERHGVLELTIPKQAKALPRRIEIAA